jgi:D-xylose 1-dehydrogenase (NADP+, D-xylono-1,5-lactone-forming)
MPVPPGALSLNPSGARADVLRLVIIDKKDHRGTPMTINSQPLRIGILGASKIARAFTKAVAGAATLKVTAVASRDAANAAAYAKEEGIPRSFGSYEALLADRDIDAIYNPLPNNMHAEWSIKAVEAGKHVLCEKPLAVSGAEARSMFDAAARHKRHLVEAFPYMAQPQTLKVRELVRGGAIGKVRLIRSCFGVPFSDTSNIRLKADLAGGSLMDAGSYAVSFVRLAAGERPSRVHAVARWSPTGVDSTLAGTIEFASGLIAQISSSFDACYHRHGLIAGDKGTIETTYLNHPPIGGPASITVRRGTLVADPVETVTLRDGNGFLAEALSFARLVAEGRAQWTGASPEESIDIALTLDALLRAARSGRPEMVG